MIRIDAHHHLWRLARGDYGWLTPDLVALYHDFDADALAPMLAAHDIGGTVLVQAAPTVAETRFLLEVAAVTPFVKGVVGWVDMAAPDAAATIDALAEDPLLKGLRPMLHDLADDDFILSPAVAPTLQAMADRGLRLDALVRPRHLPQLARLRARYPGLAIVVDHGGKPDIAGGDLDRWAADLRIVAADGLSFCKLSGLVTEAGTGWSTETLRPVVDIILAAFGPARVMWGSDWPVLTLAGSYHDWMAASHALLAGLSADDRAQVFGGTAARFYGLEV